MSETAKTKARVALQELQYLWKAHCELHDIDLPEDEDLALMKSYIADIEAAITENKLSPNLIHVAQIDKVCSMVLDEEACAAYIKRGVETIQEINRKIEV